MLIFMPIQSRAASKFKAFVCTILCVNQKTAHRSAWIINARATSGPTTWRQRGVKLSSLIQCHSPSRVAPGTFTLHKLMNGRQTYFPSRQEPIPSWRLTCAEMRGKLGTTNLIFDFPQAHLLTAQSKFILCSYFPPLNCAHGQVPCHWPFSPPYAPMGPRARRQWPICVCNARKCSQKPKSVLLSIFYSPGPKMRRRRTWQPIKAALQSNYGHKEWGIKGAQNESMLPIADASPLLASPPVIMREALQNALAYR